MPASGRCAIIAGVPSPMKEPAKIDMVIFRENTEDVYSGIEWAANTPEALRVIHFLNHQLGCTRTRPRPRHQTHDRTVQQMAGSPGFETRRENSGPRSPCPQRQHYEIHGRGISRLGLRGGAGVARKGGHLGGRAGQHPTTGTLPTGTTVVKDRIADTLFQELLLHPEIPRIGAPNLNGDYISDAVAAQVGGLGIAPGANIGDDCAVFEATHGTAPKYAGQDKVKPSSLILSGTMFVGISRAGTKRPNKSTRACPEPSRMASPPTTWPASCRAPKRYPARPSVSS